MKVPAGILLVVLGLLAGCTNPRAMIAQLENPYSEERGEAVLWLAENLKAKVTTKLLITVLVGIPAENLAKDPSPLVRTMAARAMAKDPKSLFIPPLLQALREDESHLVRFEVAQTLKVFKAPRTAPALKRALKYDSHPWVRFKAAQALAAIHNTEAINDLIDAMANDEEPMVRLNAHLALKDITGKNFTREVKLWKEWQAQQTTPADK